MKTLLIVVVFLACRWPAFMYAGAGQDLKEAYQSATVISVTRVATTANYAYDIGIRVNCTTYVARYKSANDYVPVQIAPNHPVSVLVDEHGHRMQVFQSEHSLELRLMSATNSRDNSCPGDDAGSSAAIPVGTILPVRLDSMMRSDTNGVGTAIVATLMQDVSLSKGAILRKGARVTGHLTAAIELGRGSDEARLSFQFDQVRSGTQVVPVVTNLRALASPTAVSAAQVPKTAADGESPASWNLVQIGGDPIAYGLGGPVVVGSEAVGTYTSQGVLA